MVIASSQVLPVDYLLVWFQSIEWKLKPLVNNKSKPQLKPVSDCYLTITSSSVFRSNTLYNCKTCSICIHEVSHTFCRQGVFDMTYMATVMWWYSYHDCFIQWVLAALLLSNWKRQLKNACMHSKMDPHAIHLHNLSHKDSTINILAEAISWFPPGPARAYNYNQLSRCVMYSDIHIYIYIYSQCDTLNSAQLVLSAWLIICDRGHMLHTSF